MRIAFLILVLTVLVTFPTRAEDITGLLLDAESREPVAGAIIKAVGGKGFAASKSDGSFILKGPAKQISIRCMGYETKNEEVPLKNGEILLCPKETVLNEVVVQAPDIFQKGDTLVFNVGKYATSADDAIIDVIKRLPGVKVEKDGTIMYQGKPINKFYIDGNDFVGDAYGLATNNISKDDVAAVELMENHQPIKALEDIEFSDQAGINLKLKEDAHSRWVGVTNAGGGFSPLLYSGSVFAMRLARKTQNMFTLKADNTGWNPENEIMEHSYDPMFSSIYKEALWREYISADEAGAPLSESRTRDNRSWLANAIVSWGNGDTANRLKLNYIGDRLDYSSSIFTDYFSPKIDNLNQNDVLHTRRHSLNAELKTEINKKNYFLKDNLRFDIGCQRGASSVSGSFNLNQDVTRRKLSLTNDLRLIKKTDKRIFTLSSRNGFLHNPANLSVSADYGDPTQRIGINDLRHTTESQYGLFKGFWRLYVYGGVDINYRHINLDLSHFPVRQNTAGQYNALLASAYLSPKAEYDRRGWRIVLHIPIQWRHYTLQGNHDFAIFSPNLYLYRQLTAKSDFSMQASYSSYAPDAAMFVDCAVLSDYRNLFISIPIEKNSSATSASTTYRYRNPLTAFFANISASYTYNRSPYISNKKFVNGFIFTTYEPLFTGAHNFNTKGGVSKGLCHNRLVIGLELSYSNISAATMRDDAKQDFRQEVLTANPYFKGSLNRWLSMNYTINVNVSTLKISSQSSSDAISLYQTLSFTIIPDDNFHFTLGGEHYYTRFGDSQTKDANLVLIDASASWQINAKIRLGLTARNLLDRQNYRYSTFGSLSRTDHIYRIRPRNVLLTAQLRF